MSLTMLVVLKPSMYYGEDMKEIDKLERAVRNAIGTTKKMRVSFMITYDIAIDQVADKVDIIAFYHYPEKSVRDALDRGLKVLVFNDRTFTFEVVQS